MYICIYDEITFIIKHSYISIFTNLLRTDNGIKNVKSIYS